MRLHTVATGSGGNCYLLQRDNDRIIALDCGAPWKKVMIASKFRPTSIDFALVTHSHSDHAKYVRDFERNGIEVFGPGNLQAKTKRELSGSTVVPFGVPHDVTCYGYLITVDGHRIVYMTDFGYCRYTFKSWNIDTWLIACNHTELPDVNAVKYEHVVRGHSSLQTVKDILAVNKSDSMRNVILVHASEDADTERMLTEIQETVGDSVNVVVAEKGQVIDL